MYFKIEVKKINVSYHLLSLKLAKKNYILFFPFQAVNTILEVKARYELGGGDWEGLRPKSSYKRI